MALQLKGSNGGGNNRQKLNNGTFGSGEIEETPEMKELRMKREADAAAAKEAIAKKQEEMRQKAMVLEQMEAAKKERETDSSLTATAKISSVMKYPNIRRQIPLNLLSTFCESEMDMKE